MTYVCLHPLQISKAGSLNCAKQAPGLRHHTPRSQLALAIKSNGTNVPQYQQSSSLCWFACLFFVLWVMDEGFQDEVAEYFLPRELNRYINVSEQ